VALGRAVAAPWPCKYKSVPVVMLNGVPLWATMKGENRTLHLARIDPPRNKLCVTLSCDRPQSAARLYGLAGSVPNPSVSLCPSIPMPDCTKAATCSRESIWWRCAAFVVDAANTDRGMGVSKAAL